MLIGTSAGAELVAALGSGRTPADILAALDAVSPSSARANSTDAAHISVPPHVATAEAARSEPPARARTARASADAARSEAAAPSRAAQASAAARSEPTTDQRAVDPVLAKHLAIDPGRFPPIPALGWPALGLVGAGIKAGSTYQALAGLLPRGRGDATWLREFGEALAPNGWVDHPATWLVAADAATGARVAFGAEGAPKVDLGTAIAASWGIPGWFPPVSAHGRDYVDGGSVSTASVDLLIPLELDEVIVIAPMASEGGAPARGMDRVERLLRAQMTRVLDREIAALRAAGTRVIRIEPGPTELATMGPNFMDVKRRAATLSAARAALPDLVAHAISRTEGVIG
ncbi:hypothetical protein GCM10011591_40730 [Nocardia camponoti]|uniref:PNPLA domain-containing protein n=1 Tax=Nocardia camponoti TaxID=1616106 RepID=A0A917QR74_9NOCA|nr:hypothetical protein GCM10011591_40730 [Nocardia camponoti]